MATPNYEYVPQYGVEPFDPDVGTEGGTTHTGENLIVSLWRVDDKDQGGAAIPFTYFGIVIPKSVSDGTAEGLVPAYEPGMSGRVGSRVYLADPANSGDIDTVLAVLNPPEELKQQLAGAVTFNGSVPSNLFNVSNFTFNKSLQGQFSWDIQNMGPDSSGGSISQNAWGDGQLKALIGSYIDLNLDSGTPPDGLYLPFLRTNGTDGVAPIAFDMTTEEGIQECIAAVNLGRFYIPAILTNYDDGDGSFWKISWAHSLTRG